MRPRSSTDRARGYAHKKALVDALSARIEMELGELEPEEAAVFMEELGLAESSLDRVIRLSYRLVGPDQLPHRRAGRGPRVAGPGRLERGRRRGRDPHRPRRGFIRAETIAYEELLAAGSIAEAKRHGKVRSEGKTYRVQDGDVVEILFSR